MKKYQEIQKKTERTGKTVAIISTVAFHAALVVFGVCSGLKYIYPPPPEQSFVIDFSQEEKVTVQQQRRGSAPQTEEPDRTKKRFWMLYAPCPEAEKLTALLCYIPEKTIL